MTRHPKDNELYLVRYYDAPVNTVWAAWTDPAQLALWWGPRGFTITTHSKDLRVGGHWNYTMHGPDGVDYPNVTTYFEVEEGAKLVYDHGANENQPPLFRVTVLFTEENGQTKMEMTMALATKEAAEQTEAFIKKANGYSTWDRLGEYLENQASGKEVFIINRRFDAPIEVVFDAWADPAQLAQWLSPTGTSMKFFEADIRSGGSSFYTMGNEHFTMYGRASYITVERPHLLIYTQQFCDQDGNVSRHPLSPTWPETMLTHIHFTALDAHKTLIKVQWEVTGPATAEEMKTFINGRSGMTGGWTGSFDKLESYLQSRQ
jgi:uncharacterized protein YndB with AHSA1/START domain